MNYIPLGDHCAPAIILNQLGKRNCSYPFDWIMCTPDSTTDNSSERLNSTSPDVGRSCIFQIMKWIRRLLEIEDSTTRGEINSSGRMENNRGLIIDEIVTQFLGSFKQLPNTQYYNSDYDILFPHEVGTPAQIYTKYHRRWTRLYDAMVDHTKPITFVLVTRFTTITKDQLLEWIQIIQPHSILIFSGCPIEVPEELQDKVVAYYIPYDPELSFQFDYSTFRPAIQKILEERM